MGRRYRRAKPFFPGLVSSPRGSGASASPSEDLLQSLRDREATRLAAFATKEDRTYEAFNAAWEAAADDPDELPLAVSPEPEWQGGDWDEYAHPNDWDVPFAEPAYDC
jgi:hypothetical protein